MKFRNWLLASTIIASLVASLDATQVIRLRQTPGAIPPLECVYEIYPTSDSAIAAGESGIETVISAPQGCEWTAISNEDWITVTQGSSGTSGQNQPLVGAYRHDDWDPTGGPGTNDYHRGNSVFRLQTDSNITWRLPFFTTFGPTTVNENQQSVLDQEILYANNAGIDFWAIGHYCTPGTQSTYVLQRTSPYRDRMKYAFIESDDGQCRIDDLLAEIQDPQYLTVLNGRPVVFFFLMDQYYFTNASPASAAALRAEILAASGKDPYFVGLDFDATQAASRGTTFGMDAISSYGGGLVCGGSGTSIPYSTQVSCEQTQWPQYRDTGMQYHPTITTGWEGISGIDDTPTGTFTTLEATPTEIENHLTNAVAFAQANPSSNLANMLLISAWNEYTENHFIAPFHPSTNAVGEGRIRAVGRALNDHVVVSVAANSGAARSGTVSIGGQTFTINQAEGGAASCTYSILPTSESSPAAGELNVDSAVDTQPGCEWTATSNAAWITITSGSSGTGDGTVLMDVASNAGSGRSGTVTIAGETFTVSQAGAAVGGGAIINEGDIDWNCAVGCGVAAVPVVLPTSGAYAVSLNPGAQGGYTENEGLAFRTIGGTTYFLSSANGLFTGTPLQGIIFRFSCNFSAGTCSILEEYGDVFDGKRVDICNVAGGLDNQFPAGPIGLFWQESASQLWWTWAVGSYSDDGACSVPNMSFGRSTLGSSSGTGIASHYLEGLVFERRDGSIIPIPSSQQPNFGNKEYLICNNGYHSANGSDVNLTCSALDLPTGGHLSGLSAAQYKIVIGHDWAVNCSQMDDRPTFLGNADFTYSCATNLTDWFDTHNSCIWPDNGTRTGLLCFTNWSKSGVTYTSANTGQHATATGISVWDPADLAAVYAGSIVPSAPKVVNDWEVLWPGYDYSKFPFVAHERTVSSATANDTTNVWRFNFTTSHNFQVGDRLAAYGSASPYFSNFLGAGWTVIAIIDGDTIEACKGQHDGTDGAGTILGYCTFSPIEENAGILVGDQSTSTPFTVNLMALGRTYGRIVGAVWMPTNSACGGQDNMIAVAYDAVNITDDRGNYSGAQRFIRCGKLN